MEELLCLWSLLTCKYDPYLQFFQVVVFQQIFITACRRQQQGHCRKIQCIIQCVRSLLLYFYIMQLWKEGWTYSSFICWEQSYFVSCRKEIVFHSVLELSVGISITFWLLYQVCYSYADIRFPVYCTTIDFNSFILLVWLSWFRL